jgi:hypothetical protein
MASVFVVLSNSVISSMSVVRMVSTTSDDGTRHRVMARLVRIVGMGAVLRHSA